MGDTNDALIALCDYCHEEFHENEKIPVPGKYYNFRGYYYSNCLRCDGKGYLSRNDYYQNGIYFRCQGAKLEELIINRSNTKNQEQYSNNKVSIVVKRHLKQHL